MSPATKYDLISVAQLWHARAMAKVPCIQYIHTCAHKHDSARQLAQELACIYPARNGASAVDLNGESAGCYCKECLIAELKACIGPMLSMSSNPRRTPSLACF